MEALQKQNGGINPQFYFSVPPKYVQFFFHYGKIPPYPWLRNSYMYRQPQTTFLMFGFLTIKYFNLQILQKEPKTQIGVSWEVSRKTSAMTIFSKRWNGNNFVSINGFSMVLLPLNHHHLVRRWNGYVPPMKSIYKQDSWESLRPLVSQIREAFRIFFSFFNKCQSWYVDSFLASQDAPEVTDLTDMMTDEDDGDNENHSL